MVEEIMVVRFLPDVSFAAGVKSKNPGKPAREEGGGKADEEAGNGVSPDVADDLLLRESHALVHGVDLLRLNQCDGTLNEQVEANESDYKSGSFHFLRWIVQGPILRRRN